MLLTSPFARSASILASLLVTFSQPQFSGAQADPYHDFEYQFQVAANVEECPPEGPPPFRLFDPTISARKKAVILSYDVLVPDPEWVAYEVFDAASCTIPIPTGTSGNEPLIPTLEVRHEALTGTATAKLTLEVNEAGLKEYGALIYTETERSGVAPNIESTGDVTFCVRMSIYNGLPSEATENATDGSGVIQVTWVDTETQFVARLDIEDEAMLDFSVAQQRCTGPDCRRTLKKESTNNLRSANAAVTHSHVVAAASPPRYERRLCESTWGMEIVTCPDAIDESSTEAFTLVDEPNGTPIPKSENVRLCIQPNAAAREAGVTMKRVENLYFRLLPLVQPAVEAGFISGDGLTTTACGDNMCIVESTMYDQFYGPGTTELMVSGTVLFQPNQATTFNQIHVDFEMPIMITLQGGSGSAGFSAKSVVSMGLFATGVLALLL